MIPDIPVLTSKDPERVFQLFREHKNYGKLHQSVEESYEKVENILKKRSHKVLHDNLGYYVVMELNAMKMMAIHDLVDDGVLKPPEATREFPLGMFIGFI